MNTSMKQTPRVGPNLSLFLLADSLWDKHLAKTDTKSGSLPLVSPLSWLFIRRKPP